MEQRKIREVGENLIQSIITSSRKWDSRLEVKGLNSRLDHRKERPVKVISQNNGTVWKTEVEGIDRSVCCTLNDMKHVLSRSDVVVGSKAKGLVLTNIT